jgi:hypothetical protein
MHFQEVSGLDGGQPIEYRHGDSPRSRSIKMPGMKKYSERDHEEGRLQERQQVLGLVQRDQDEHGQAQAGDHQPARRGRLADHGLDAGQRLAHKVTGTDLKAEGNEVAVESIEIAHEGLT